MDDVWSLVDRTPGARALVEGLADGERETRRVVLAHVLRVGGHDARTVSQVYELAPHAEFMRCVHLCLRAWCADVRDRVGRGEREFATALAALAVGAGQV